MNLPKPHFLLFCEGSALTLESSGARSGKNKGQAPKNARWRFVLENVNTGEKFEANDLELGCTPDRASLIAVLRGLEALEQPSKVTLVTGNRYVFRGLRYGLAEWRENDFAWEHFGAVQPIRNADVWRRIDRTLSYHEVQCRWMAMGDAVRSNPSDSGEIQWSVAAAAAKEDAASANSSVPSPHLQSSRHTASVLTITGNSVASKSVASNWAGANSGEATSHEIHAQRSTKVYKDAASGAVSLEQSLESSLAEIEEVVHSNFADLPPHQFAAGSESQARTHYVRHEAHKQAPTNEQMPRSQQAYAPEPQFAASVGPSNENIDAHATTDITATPTTWPSKNAPTTESLTKSEDLTDEQERGHSPRSLLFYPFAICWSICKRLLVAVWEAILRLDEGVESYLRCMLLLDPKHYRRRK